MGSTTEIERIRAARETPSSPVVLPVQQGGFKLTENIDVLTESFTDWIPDRFTDWIPDRFTDWIHCLSVRIEHVTDWIDRFSIPMEFTEAALGLALILFVCVPLAWSFAEKRLAGRLALQAIVLLVANTQALSGVVAIVVLIVDLLIVWNLIRSALKPIGVPVDGATTFVVETIRNLLVATIQSLLDVLLRALLLPVLRALLLPPLNLLLNLSSGVPLLYRPLNWLLNRLRDMRE